MTALAFAFGAACVAGVAVAARLIFCAPRPSDAERLVLGVYRWSAMRALRLGDLNGRVGAPELEAFRVCIRRGWIAPRFGVGGTVYGTTAEGDKVLGR